MNKVVFVTVGWPDAKERMRLDFRTLQRKRRGRLSSWEEWGAKKVVGYFPRYSYECTSSGSHILKLTYARSEHPEISVVDADKISWGTATLELAANLKTAVAAWEGTDGKNKDVPCVVAVESPSTIKDTQAKVRAAQQAFKNSVVKFGGRCEISEETLSAVLDAAHVLGVEHGGSDAPENGLILRSDLHRLFDAGLIAFRRDGSVAVRRGLSKEYVKFFADKTLSLNTMRRIRPYLEARRSVTVK